MQGGGSLPSLKQVRYTPTNVLISPAQIASPSNESFNDPYSSNALPEHAQSTPLSWSSQCKTPTLPITTIVNNNHQTLSIPLSSYQTTNSATTTTYTTVSTQPSITTTVTTSTLSSIIPIMSTTSIPTLHTPSNQFQFNSSNNEKRVTINNSPKHTEARDGNDDSITIQQPVMVAPNGTIPKNKKNTKNNQFKPQTGIDRYITITKRKRSPNSTKVQPTPKILKNTVPSNATNSNRFSILNNDEDENNILEPVKEYKPPPIYLREENSNSLVNSLSQIAGTNNFFVESLRRGQLSETKIQIYTESNYRKVISYLDNNKKSYYTHQLKSAKGLLVVVKGIESSVPTNEIMSAIENEGYEVKSVHNIINKDKIPQPLHRVEIAFDSKKLKKNEPHPIYNLRYLLHRKITVEEPRKRRDPPQCLNCQEFGHTKTYCRLPSVCVICGDIHKTSDCPNPKNSSKVLRCSNCGENHTANFRGCPVFLRLKKNAPKKRSNHQLSYNGISNLPIDMGTNQQNISSSQNNINSNLTNILPTPRNPSNSEFSYAQVVREHKSLPEKSNLEASIEALIQTMNNFISNMQGLMQELLRNQGMLLQAFTSNR